VGGLLSLFTSAPSVLFPHPPLLQPQPQPHRQQPHIYTSPPATTPYYEDEDGDGGIVLPLVFGFRFKK